MSIGVNMLGTASPARAVLEAVEQAWRGWVVKRADLAAAQRRASRAMGGASDSKIYMGAFARVHGQLLPAAWSGGRGRSSAACAGGTTARPNYPRHRGLRPERCRLGNTFDMGHVFPAPAPAVGDRSGGRSAPARGSVPSWRRGRFVTTVENRCPQGASIPAPMFEQGASAQGRPAWDAVKRAPTVPGPRRAGWERCSLRPHDRARWGGGSRRWCTTPAGTGTCLGMISDLLGAAAAGIRKPADHHRRSAEDGALPRGPTAVFRHRQPSGLTKPGQPPQPRTRSRPGTLSRAGRPSSSSAVGRQHPAAPDFEGASSSVSPTRSRRGEYQPITQPVFGTWAQSRPVPWPGVEDVPHSDPWRGSGP